MVNLGDRALASVISFDFNTHKADGTPITLAGTPAISVYKNSTTETTTGVTLTVDYDSRTGMHHVVIDTADAFYATNTNFSVVITTGTVDGVSVVGTVVAVFSIGRANVAYIGSTAQTARDLGNALPAIAPGAKGGLPVTDASTGLILTGYSGGTVKNDLVDAPNATALTAMAMAFWNVLTSALTTVNSIGKKLADWVVGTITANQSVNVAQWGGANIVTPAVSGSPVVTLGGTQTAYAPAKAGDKMDIQDIPNSTAIAAFKTGLADMDVSFHKILSTVVTAQMAAAWVKFFDVAASVLTTASVNQGADNNVLLASASKGLVKVYDDMAKDSTVSKPGTAQTITVPSAITDIKTVTDKLNSMITTV